MWLGIFPLIFSAASLVLSFLSLLAGYKEGFMEEYYVARVNVSKLAATFLLKAGDNDNKNSNNSEDDLPILIPDGISHGEADIPEEAADLLDDIVDGKTIWYSVHIMTGCEGIANPDPVDNSPLLRAGGCTRPTAGLSMYDFECFDILLLRPQWPEPPL
ncbi:hypothetical protein FANTH_14188 [Fusarium anthophilum]|uniref:Uncharacterized protein n=1 Tax=Fusarium anthophilum TaxID=48485 RepID=A0A8H4YJW9_9HYPO|nr:hypothetical protein FANTH_14188 [Fusarium anthophilum]